MWYSTYYDIPTNEIKAGFWYDGEHLSLATWRPIYTEWNPLAAKEAAEAQAAAEAAEYADTV